jgi:hypothetical protein
MTLHRKLFPMAVAAVLVLLNPVAVDAAPAGSHHGARLLVTGLAGGAGSTVGPDGALYVTERLAGRISRVDRNSGAFTTYATGLPIPPGEPGGAMDIAFLGTTAYVLVTLVGPDVGGGDVVGLYRVDGPNTVTVVADIGAYAIAHPPPTEFQVPSGLQYAMQPYAGGFLITDGHHNRLLRVTPDGAISQVVQFDNIVPTGLARWGNTVYMAEAGPVPHLPEDGKIVAFDARFPAPREVTSGGPLLVDVEFGPRRTLYGLAQGVFVPGGQHGSPASPNTGQLLRVGHDGAFALVADGLDRPTSVEVVGNTAYVVTLTGEIWTVRL